MMFAQFSQRHFASRAHPSPVRSVLVVNGHPQAGLYCAALCAAYAEGARSRGYQASRLDIGLATMPGGEGGREFWLQNHASEILERLWMADRLFIAFPMCLDGPPPALSLILKELARWQGSEAAQLDEPAEAKDADIVVTASYPGLVYRANHSGPGRGWPMALSGLNITQAILIGSVASISHQGRDRWLSDVRNLGASYVDCAPGRRVLQ